jgi:hypothetical protein
MQTRLYYKKLRRLSQTYSVDNVPIENESKLGNYGWGPLTISERLSGVGRIRYRK